MVDSIAKARRRYAEELRFTAKVGSRAVVEAFGTVPREHFFKPGPWRILSPMAIAEYCQPGKFWSGRTRGSGYRLSTLRSSDSLRRTSRAHRGFGPQYRCRCDKGRSHGRRPLSGGI